MQQSMTVQAVGLQELGYSGDEKCTHYSIAN